MLRRGRPVSVNTNGIRKDERVEGVPCDYLSRPTNIFNDLGKILLVE